jgi:transcriptional regulator with XRE-family HTH domain
LTLADGIPTISGMAENHEDPAMAKVRKAVEKSGMTQQQLGEKMGCPPTSARQAVSQMLRAGDPRIGTLRRLAKALGVKLESLI